MDGSLPTSKADILTEWSNYFSTLLNNKNANEDKRSYPHPAPDNSAIPTSPITRKEVLEAIKVLKLNKSPGRDYAMTAEVLQKGGTFVVDQVLVICNKVYSECFAPTQWTSSIIIPLPKKGDLQLMTNYRGISLMSIAAKVYNRVLLNRILKPIDAILRKNQAGFRIGRSCIQQIHILRRIMEGALLDGCPLFITFIDFKKAFDSIDREMMFAILRHYGIPQVIVSAIRVLYDSSTSQVYVEGQFSEQFKVTTGVLQGDVLAPFLFIIVIDYVQKQSAGDFGYITHTGTKHGQRTSLRYAHVNEEYKLNDLDFADDIALLESDMTRSQQQLDAHKVNAGKVGLEINVKKTEQMRLNQPNNTAPIVNLGINGEDIATVKDFKYLGAHMESTEKDVQARIGLAWAAFHKLEPILKSAKTPLNFKIRLFNAACVSILLYGCETWVLTKDLANDLDIFARKAYRIILGIRQSETHWTNEKLYKIVNSEPITTAIRIRQLKFTGHCLRMNNDELANKFILYESNNTVVKRTRQQRTTYTHQISGHLSRDKNVQLSALEIAHYAKVKKDWNYLIAAPKKPDR